MMNETNSIEVDKEMVVEDVEKQSAIDLLTKVEKSVEAPKQENMFLGFLGALLGSIIGVILIIIIGQLGYIASIAGVAMGAATLVLYKKFAGSMSKKGLIICILTMIVMVYVGDRIEWALMLSEEFGTTDYSLFDYYSVIPSLISEGYIELNTYLSDLGLLYFFTLIGVVPTVKKYGID